MRPSSLLLVLLAVVAAASQTRAQRHCYRALDATLGSPALAPPSSGPALLSSAHYLLRPCSPALSSVGRLLCAPLRCMQRIQHTRRGEGTASLNCSIF